MTFTIDKPQDFSAVLSKASSEINNGGGTFSGTENSGKASAWGVEGSYEVVGDSIRISISKKPFIYPAFFLEKFIREYFQSA